MNRVGPLLARAGVPVVQTGEGAEYWQSFVETTTTALELLGGERSQ